MTKGQLVDTWTCLLHDSPTTLIDATLDRLVPTLDPASRALLKTFVEHVREQTKWIEKASAELVSETARAREIGRTMQLAGLRSYTDKEGRIYVASPSGGEP